MSGLKAGFLRHWRRRLADSIRLRSETVADFCRRLALCPIQGPTHPYLRLPVLAATPVDKERIYALSRQLGLGLSAAYPTPVNQIRQISAVFDGRQFPGAKRVATRLLTIPTHHWLSETDKRAIVSCLSMMIPEMGSPRGWPSPPTVEALHRG
jgi:dTDP-4-amino-4,6-dideoxygalactose transaminase